jgi:hypothetical protein
LNGVHGEPTTDATSRTPPQTRLSITTK